MGGSVRRQLEEEEESQSMIAASQVRRVLAKRWRTLNDKEKASYRQRYSILRDEYQQKKKLSSSGESGSELKGALRTPFLVYTKTVYREVRSELPQQTSSREIFRDLGRRWRTLTPEQKQPYVTACWAAKMVAASIVEEEDPLAV
jgi:hypothetical protein